MPYNFAADSLHTKKLCSRFLQAKCDFLWKSAVLRFWGPFGDLGGTYDDHFRRIGKRVVDFLLALIELFFARCYGWGATSDYRFKIGDFAPTGAGWPKISGRRVALPTNHSFSQKTRLNYLSCGIKIWTDFSFVLSQCTRLTDGQTDGRTDTFLIASPRWHSMQRGKKSCVCAYVHC